MQSVLDYFEALRKPSKVRDVCYKLIKHLEKSQATCEKDDTLSTEMKYALKRLIRGLGSADQNTVVGFSACLASLLKSQSSRVKMSMIQEFIESELELKSSLLRGEEGMVSFGRVLVYGCVIRSDIFQSLSEEDKSFILDQLLLYCYKRSYISAPVYYYIEQFLKLVEFDKKFVKIVLSHILNNKFHMNIDMLHLLLSLQTVDLPSLLQSKNKFAITTTIPNIHQIDTLAEFVNILIDIRSSEDLNRDVFARFSSYIIGSPRLLSVLWSEVESKVLASGSDVNNMTILKKLAVFKLFCSLVLHCETTAQVLPLLTPNFLSLSLRFTSEIPTDLVPSLSPMGVLSAKFTNKLVARCNKERCGFESLERSSVVPEHSTKSGVEQDDETDDDDEVGDEFQIVPSDVLAMMEKFLTPTLIIVEKITHTKILHTLINTLDRDHVTKLATLYKQILTSEQPVNQNGTPNKKSGKGKKERKSGPEGPNSGGGWGRVGFNNKDRIYVLNLLSRLVFHPSLSAEGKGKHNEDITSDVWRYEQVRYIFNLALGLNLNNHELSSAYKRCLFSLLGHNLHHEVLGKLVQYADEMIQSGQTKNVKLTPEITACWRQCLDMLTKLNKKIASCKSKSNSDSKKSISGIIDSKKSVLIAFQTMYLQLCLYLFLDNSISMDVIEELNSCYERFNEKKSNTKEDDNEPHWVEVITELFLSLLSKDSVLLRHLVSKVFKHLLPVVNVQAVQQILQVLDPSQNPLKNKMEESDEEEEGEDGDKEEDGSENEDIDSGNDSESASDNDEEVEDEESELDEEYLGNESNTDKLRQAVNQALGMNGNVTDAESIDLSDMDGPEAAQLDVALAAAFKAIKRPSASKRPSKFAAQSESRLVSFRVRVLDLVDILVGSPSPSTSGNVALDILATLFQLLRYTLPKPSQKPLEFRVRAVLAHATGVKKGAMLPSDELSEQVLTDVLVNSVLEKGEASLSSVQSISNEISNAVLYLMRLHSATQKYDSYQQLSESKFLQTLLESFESSFTKRQSIIPGHLFSRLCTLSWKGNAHLLSSLPSHAFNPALRFYNRAHALTLLLILLRNRQFLTLVREEKSFATSVRGSLETVIARTTEFLSSPSEVSKAISSYSKNLCDVVLALKSLPDLIPASSLNQLKPALSQLSVNSPPLTRLYAAFDVKKPTQNPASVPNGHNDNAESNASDNEEGDKDSDAGTEEGDEPVKKKKKHRASKSRKKNKLLRLADLSKGIEDVGGFGTLHIDKDIEESMEVDGENEGVTSDSEGASSENEGAINGEKSGDKKRRQKKESRKGNKKRKEKSENEGASIENEGETKSKNSRNSVKAAMNVDTSNSSEDEASEEEPPLKLKKKKSEDNKRRKSDALNQKSRGKKLKVNVH